MRPCPIVTLIAVVTGNIRIHHGDPLGLIDKPIGEVTTNNIAAPQLITKVPLRIEKRLFMKLFII